MVQVKQKRRAMLKVPIGYSRVSTSLKLNFAAVWRTEPDTRHGGLHTGHRHRAARRLARVEAGSMSNPNHHQIDPRLGGPSLPPLQQYTPQRQPPPPPAPAHTFGGTPRSDSLHPPSDGGVPGGSSNPYYHDNLYPSPQTQTPQQPTGPQSTQPSPPNHQLYQAGTAQQVPLSPEQGDEQGEDAKRPRACEACRGLKVRCDQDPTHPEQPCRRCAKAGRQCIITQPTRKRQKKSDTRVAELEKKLDALTAALQQSQQGGAGPYQPPPPPVERSAEAAPEQRASYDGAVGSFPPP